MYVRFGDSSGAAANMFRRDVRPMATATIYGPHNNGSRFSLSTNWASQHVSLPRRSARVWSSTGAPQGGQRWHFSLT